MASSHSSFSPYSIYYATGLVGIFCQQMRTSKITADSIGIKAAPSGISNYINGVSTKAEAYKSFIKMSREEKDKLSVQLRHTALVEVEKQLSQIGSWKSNAPFVLAGCGAAIFSNEATGIIFSPIDFADKIGWAVVFSSIGLYLANLEAKKKSYELKEMQGRLLEINDFFPSKSKSFARVSSMKVGN